MFLRSVKAANGRHEYLRLVESYREGDKIRQRIVLHVGRKDLLAPHLGRYARHNENFVLVSRSQPRGSQPAGHSGF